jgi:xanthosine utilization system XapX-like protein
VGEGYGLLNSTMFGLFKSVIPIVSLMVLLALLGMYVKIQSDRIAALKTTTDLMALSNARMEQDVAHVVAAQLLAGQAIARARLDATQAMHAVQTQNFSTTAPTKLQIDINKSMADVFNDLQTTTRSQ